MINFRYHLVSLISVFLALAVGVVLGAGPLQNAITRIGDDSSTADLDPQAQALLAEAEAEGAAGQELAAAIGRDVLPGSIPATKVTLVALPGVTEADMAPTVEALEEAGAEVQGPVQLSENFVSPEASTYRETLSSPVSGHLSARPSSPTASTILAAGLVDMLLGEGSESELIRELLTDESTPLVEGGTVPSSPSGALMLMGPGPTSPETEESESADLAPATQEVWAALAAAFADAGVPAVAVGQAGTDQDLVAVLRTVSSPLSTVDRGASPMGGLNAALVIATGATGAFGSQEGATAVLAPLP